jgi:hypothetical protein
MRALRNRCMALPEPYQAQALEKWEEARQTLERYPGNDTAEAQIRFDLAQELSSFEFQVMKDQEGD